MYCLVDGPSLFLHNVGANLMYFRVRLTLPSETVSYFLVVNTEVIE